MNQFTNNQYADISANSTNQITSDKYQIMKAAMTPTRQFEAARFDSRDGIKHHNTQDAKSPKQLLDSQQAFQSKKNTKQNGHASQTMHNQNQQPNSTPQKQEEFVPLTPVVMGQKRKNGNLSLQNRHDKPKIFSSQNVDELKSIDEYKAQISSQIRIQNNQNPAISARNDISAARSSTQTKNPINFKSLQQSPDISNFNSPMEPRDSQYNSFHQQQIIQHQSGKRSPEDNQKSFLPNIEQKMNLTEPPTNLNSQNASQMRSPSKLIQQLKKTDENWSHDDFAMGKESNDGTQGRSGSRLLMQNGKQNNQVLRTLQQHVTQRQHNNTATGGPVATPKTGPGGQYNNQQLLALAQMHQQNAVQQLLNTSANGLKNLRQNFNQSQHIVQSNFQMSPQKQGKDHQLEGLNETLQRLAREKAHGKQTVNKKAKSVKPDKTNQKMLYDAYPIQNSTINPGQTNLSFLHPQAHMDQTVKAHGKKKSKRDKGHTPPTLENLRQKLEAQQRSNMIMNDTMGAVRLQGVNQKGREDLRMTNSQLTAQPQGIDGNVPYSIHNDTRSFIKDLNQAVRLVNQQPANQIHMKSKSFDPNSTSSKVYKLNMSQIRMRDPNNTSVVMAKTLPQNILNEMTPSQLSQYQKNYNYANMAGQIPDELLLPTEPSLEQEVPTRVSVQTDTNMTKDSEVNRSINKSSAQSEKRGAYSPTVAATVLQRLQLNTNNQFSSVIEDVENEQMHSPSPNHIQEEDRAGRLRADRGQRQFSHKNDSNAPESPKFSKVKSKSPKNSRQSSIDPEDLKPQGLKLKLMAMDQNRYPKQKPPKPSAPEPTQDDDVYTRIVNKINVIIENKRSIEHSREQLRESIEGIKEQTEQNQQKSTKRYPKSPNGISQNDQYGEGVILIPDHSQSTHSKRYKSNTRGREDKLDLIKTQESNNNINVKKQKNQVVQDLDISPQYQINTIISPSMSSNGSQSLQSLNKIQLQNIEQRQQDLNNNENQQLHQNQQQFKQTSPNKKQVVKHQTQIMFSQLSNASDDQNTNTKKLELPTIDSINKMQKGGQTGSDHGSQARRYKAQKEENIGTSRCSQQHITPKNKPPKGPSPQKTDKQLNLGNIIQKKDQIQQQSGQMSTRSRRPLVAQKQAQGSPLKMAKLKRGAGGQSSMINNQRNSVIVKQPSVISIEGYESSETPVAFNQIELGRKIIREGKTFCTEYVQHRGCQNLPKQVRHLFTPRALRQNDGSFSWSQRLFMSKECATSEERRMLPILIINLDGAMGFWDDQKKNYYVLRPKIIDGLAQLSYDFRLVAVSSQKKKLINKLVYGLINIPPDWQEGSSVSKAIVFDAVYQLATENEDNKFRSFRKNIDEIHFDLSQVLLDMQFSKHKPEPDHSQKNSGAMSPSTLHEQFQTFWQTDSYRPFKKVIVLTTHTYHHSGTCYSYDYNFLFQASKFKHEQSKKAPIVIQLPHLRTQSRVTFESALQLIFTIESVAYSIACGKQPQQKRFEGELHHNPDFSSFEICKKYLCSKWRLLDAKMKRTSVVKGLRIFDQKEDPFVDLELIDFNESYKFLKKYYKERQSDWLKLKKYYLMLKPQEKALSPLKIKQNLKVTFNESPEIRRIGEDRAGSRAVATTQDSSKSDRITAVKTQFVSEEAKNVYNGLMIRNYKIQQEVNAYARHFRIQNQRKIAMKAKLEQEEKAQEEADGPIVIYDGDQEKRKNVLRSSFKKTKKKEVEQTIPKKIKEYALKYRVLKIRPSEEPDENSFIDLTKYQAINLRSKFNYMMNSIRNPVADKVPGTSTPMSQNNFFTAAEQLSYIQSHSSKEVIESMDKRNQLIDLLSKRQNKIQYSTNQEMHLKNNLNQLVDGEQQYKEQQKELNEAEKLVKENEPEPGRKDKKEPLVDYLDNL